MSSRIDHRHVARLLALGRVGLGVTMLVRPVAVRSWLGDVVDRREVKVAVRGLAMRDLVLGIGTLRALDRGDAMRPWLSFAAAADLTDAVATATGVRSLPRTAIAGFALAAGSAALSLLGRPHVD